MSWIEKLLLRFVPHFDITKDIDGQRVVYLRRFYFWRSKYLNIFLHHILRSDDDPDPHTHPFKFISLILKGGYREDLYRFSSSGRADYVKPPLALPDTGLFSLPMQIYGYRQYLGQKVHLPGAIVRRDVMAVHKVLLDPGQTSWSLFVTGPECRDWGFVKNDRWIYWRAYLNNWSINRKDFA